MVSLENEDVEIFKLLKCRIESPPRTILTSDQEKPLVVFTDGACETECDVFVGSVGAVIFDPRNLADVKAFGVHVPEVLLEEWKSAGKRHLLVRWKCMLSFLLGRLGRQKLAGGVLNILLIIVV